MKKTLAILLALVLCLSVFAFIACDKCEHEYVNGECTKCGAKDPNYKPQGGGDVNVPVVDGKVTVYFTMAADSVEMPSYASVYFAGGLSSTGSTANGDYVWPTNLSAPEFTKMEGSNVYYIQIAYDATKEQVDEYALVLGYNKTSGLPDDKCGLVWNDAYKSDYCATFPFGSNAKFEYTDGQKTIDLGTHKFSTKVAAPETCDEVTLKITLSAPLGENGEVYIMGGFNGWDMAKAKATANDDGTVYSVALENILCTNYDYKVLIIRDKTAATTTKLEEGKEEPTELGIWDWNMTEPVFPEGVEHNEESVIRAYIEVGATDGGNLAMAILKADDGSYIDLAGTISETNADREEVKTGLNLAQVDLVEGKDGEVGNNVFTYKYQTTLPQKTFVITFAEALPEYAEVYMMGSMNGWNDSFAAGQAKMTISEDRKSASITLEVLPGEYEANIIAVHADYQVAGAQAVYDNGVKINQGDVCLANGNLPVVVADFKDGEIELFEEAQAVPTLTYVAEVAVTFKVTFSEALTGKEVYLAGQMNGWTPTLMTANDDNTEFTLTMNVNPKDFEFAVCVCEPGAANKWEHKIAANAPAYGGDVNAVVTVTEAGVVVLFEGITLVGPETAAAQ